MSKDYYKTLGVSKTASHDDIKKAYRALSMKWHPDRNQGDPSANAKFQKINEAYEHLGDEQKRREYDNPAPAMSEFFGGNPFHMHMGPMGNMGPMGMGQMGGLEEHILKSFFGGHPGFGQGFGQGFGPNVRIFTNGIELNLTVQLNIQFDQAFTGATLPVEIERVLIENNSKSKETETIYVTVPEGIDDGEMIVMQGRGNSVNGQRGDLKVAIKVSNTTKFERKGIDLFYRKTITLKEALCGFAFELNHVNGKKYNVNNNGSIIKPDYKKVLNSLGLSRDSRVGNLIIIFSIEFPSKLTDDQLTKLRELL